MQPTEKPKKRIIKLAKPLVKPLVEPVAEPVAEPLAKPIAEPVAEPIAEPVAEPVAKPKRKIILAKVQKPQVLPLITEPITLAKQAFLNIIEYYKEKNLPVPAEDIKWYEEELLREKKEDDEFWERCAVTKACMEGVLRGDDEWAIQLAENTARQKVKALPIQESDLGPMPEYGTKEFWAWCSKRKKLKEQKDAAIIAAGGTVKQAKPKVKKSQK
jgi:hypothetical protein